MYELINPGCKMMVNCVEEETFLLSSIKPHHDVLEWGSGLSTIEIGKIAKSVVSIEYQKKWYDEIKTKIPDNCQLYYVPLNKDPDISYSDGTYSDCKDYVDFPKQIFENGQSKYKKYDIIFIDGRARVYCAQLACELLNEGGLIFIHDYHHWKPQYVRHEYYVVEKFLDRINGAYAMWKFKPKTQNKDVKIL